MQWLAQQIMHDRYRAVLVCAVTALLALLIPPLGVLSAAAVMLVVLRHGLQESLTVTVIGLLVLGLFGQFAFGGGVVMLVSGAILWLPSILLGGVLRWSRHLPWAIEGALLIAILVFAAQHLMIDDPAMFWKELVTPTLEQLAQGGAFQAEEVSTADMAAAVAKNLPLLLSVGFFLQLVIAVLIGRWWQAMLYNPGGFRDEFYRLRLDRILALIALPLFVGSIMAGSDGLLAGIGLLILTAFALQGLAVAHAMLDKLNAGGWLIGVYLLLLFAGPYLLMLLGFVGYADVWSDFRRRQLNKQD